MVRKGNILLNTKIDLMDIDNNEKKILKEIIFSEIQKGDSQGVKKYKTEACLEIIARGRK